MRKWNGGFSTENTVFEEGSICVISDSDAKSTYKWIFMSSGIVTHVKVINEL